MNFGSKLCPLECTQAKKLTDGRLVRLGRHGRPHIRRTTDITVSQKLTLSKLRWAKNAFDHMELCLVLQTVVILSETSFYFPEIIFTINFPGINLLLPAF